MQNQVANLSDQLSAAKDMHSQVQGLLYNGLLKQDINGTIEHVHDP